MPELPEVETIRRGLEAVLVGSQITHVEVRRKALRFPFPLRLNILLTGKKIVMTRRRAKYLLFFFNNGQVLISHLGMSGSWWIEKASGEEKPFVKKRKEKHDHFVMHVIQEGKMSRIIYNDPRRFGFFLLCRKDDLEQQPMLKKLGIEPMSDHLSGAFLQKSFASKRHVNLKSILLDQGIVCGLGNIYVCEILWRAKLSPLCKAIYLADTGNKQAVLAAERLSDSIFTVLTEAIAAGGSHLRNYVQTDGSTGYFQQNFEVYGKESRPCSRCEEKIVRLIQAGRSTFYCPYCQEKL